MRLPPLAVITAELESDLCRNQRLMMMMIREEAPEGERAIGKKNASRYLRNPGRVSQGIWKD